MADTGEWHDLFSKFDAPTEETAIPATDPDNTCCAHCGSRDVVMDDCMFVCTSCNTVHERFIDPGAEWRFFNDGKQKDPSRCGMPVSDLMPEASMSTFIGMPTSYKNYRQMAQISRYQMWQSMPYRERSLFHAIDHLTVKAVNSGISQSIIDEAKVLFKRITDMHLSRGENRVGLLASSIYVACKNNSVPRDAKEIADIFSIDSEVVTRNCKRFQEVLQLRLPASVPTDYVMRFSSQLQLPQDLQAKSVALVTEIERAELMPNWSPQSIVAGCIFAVAQSIGYKLSKRDVAKVCGVSEVTVNKCYNFLIGNK